MFEGGQPSYRVSGSLFLRVVLLVVALVSGNRDNAGKCGSWACNLNNAGVANSNIGASLSNLMDVNRCMSKTTLTSW